MESSARTHLPPPVWPSFNPFLRRRSSLCTKLRTAILGVVLVPFRLVGFLLSLLCSWLVLRILALGHNYETPYSGLRLRCMQLVARCTARSLLWWLGFLWLHERSVGKDPKGAPSTPRIIVSNHLGFCEIFYLTARFGCCYVAKSSTRSIPLFGFLSQTLQTLYVDRGSSDHKNSVVAAAGSPAAHADGTVARVVQRLHDAEGQWPPLAMFPEGTTTNGSVLLRFRTGAFVAGLPVLPLVMRHGTHAYDPHFTCTNPMKHLLGLMAQPFNVLEATRLPYYVPNQQGVHCTCCVSVVCTH